MEFFLILWGFFVVIIVPIMAIKTNTNAAELRQRIETLEKKLQQHQTDSVAVLETRVTPFLAIESLSELMSQSDLPKKFTSEQNIEKPEELSDKVYPPIAFQETADKENTSALENNEEPQAEQTAITAIQEIRVLPIVNKAEETIQAQNTANPTNATLQPISLSQEVLENNPEPETKKQTTPENQTTRPSPYTYTPQTNHTKIPTSPGLFARISGVVKNWLTTGNIPVKIGVLILFAGVAALLRYATQQGWIAFPMQARLITVAGFSTVALAFALYKRKSHRTFSLSVQGGALGILMLDVYAAFKLYGFVSDSYAFAITVLLVAATALLAVLQNALTLAIFSILAGFLAPIWLSTNSDNYVALFSYYAILNAGIFIMSWWRSWRMLNALGFVFTFGIATLWGAWSYTPHRFATVELFLILFFAFYLLLPLLYARLQNQAITNEWSLFNIKKDRAQIVDAFLVFGTPLVVYSLQAILLNGNRYALGFNAFACAAIYAVLAHWCRYKKTFAPFVLAYQGLAFVFATLAIPLTYAAEYTGCIYALEGALLLWWGTKLSLKKIQQLSWGMHALVIVAYMKAFNELLQFNQHALAINTFMLALMYVLPAIYFYRQEKLKPFSFIYQGFALCFTLLAVPLEFSLQQTTYIYVLIGAIVLWWSVKNALIETQRASWAIQIIAAILYINTVSKNVHHANFDTLVAHTFMLALIYVLPAIYFYRKKKYKPYSFIYQGIALCFTLLAVTLEFSLQQTIYIFALIGAVVLWWSVRHTLVKTQLASWAIQGLVIMMYTHTFVQNLFQANFHALAINTFVLALLYAVCAGYFYRQEKDKPSSFIYQGFSLAFAVLAITLEFSAQTTSYICAFIGAIVLWWSVKHTLRKTQLVNWAIHGLVAFAFLSTFNIHLLYKGGNTLAANSFMLTLIYLALACVLYYKKALKPFSIHYLAIAFAYLTFTVPLNFSAQTTSYIYALGSIPIVWFGLKHTHKKIQNIGLTWQTFAVLAFIHAFGKNHYQLTGTLLFINTQSINILLLCGVFFLNAHLYNNWRLKTAGLKEQTLQNAKIKAGIFYAIGLLWWILLGCKEIYLHAASQMTLTCVIAFTAFSMGLASFVNRKIQQNALSFTIGAGFVIAIILCALQIMQYRIPLLHYGWLAWLSYSIFGAYSLCCLRKQALDIGQKAQLLWLITWGVLTISSLYGYVDQMNWNPSWYYAAITAPVLLGIVLTLWKWPVLSWPLGKQIDTQKFPMQCVLFSMAGISWIISLVLPADAAPLPWCSLLNPVEILEIATLFLLWYWLQKNEKLQNVLSDKRKKQIMATLVFALSMVIILRAVHHWGGVAWNSHIFLAKLTQTSLSIVWSILGVYAWVQGSKRQQRNLWIFGAILMGIVLIKLLLIDRQNLGNELGIISFIAYGLLCILTGYLAPAPPKNILKPNDSSFDKIEQQSSTTPVQTKHSKNKETKNAS